LNPTEKEPTIHFERITAERTADAWYTNDVLMPTVEEGYLAPEVFDDGWRCYTLERV